MGFFDSLRESIGRFADSRRTVFDPSLLGDPLALRIEWSPMVSGGTNFRTHALHGISEHRMELRPTFGAWTFGGMFLAIGAGTIYAAIHFGFQGSGFDSLPLVLLLFGIPFGAVGIWALKRMTVRRTFDSREGFWWTGSVPPSEDPSMVRLGKASPLADIHAVQLVTELLSRSKGGSYESTEINLVLRDGSRRHLVDHGGDSIADDAERLARFLGVPLWSQKAARRPLDPARDPSFEQILRERFASRKAPSRERDPGPP